MRAPQPFERGTVHVIALALAEQRMQPFVRLESQPREILEDARFVLRPAADAIVVFHPQQHASARLARGLWIGCEPGARAAWVAGRRYNGPRREVRIAARLRPARLRPAAP